MSCQVHRILWPMTKSANATAKGRDAPPGTSTDGSARSREFLQVVMVLVLVMVLGLVAAVVLGLRKSRAHIWGLIFL